MSNEGKEPGLTRRDFVGGTGAALGAMAVAGAAIGGTATAASDPKTLMATARLVQPLTDELRQSVREDFPELVSETWISQDLRDKAVEAMAISLAMSTFKRWSDVPGWAIPQVAEYGPDVGAGLKPPGKGQPVHLRLTARIAKGYCELLKDLSPIVDIHEEVAFIGALIHDIGKTYESDPVNESRWTEDKSAVGYPSLRHPSWGLFPAMLAGLPEEVLHCILCHSYEGNLVERSLECYIVYQADLAAWLLPIQAGLMVDESLFGDRAMAMEKSVGLKVNPRALKGDKSGNNKKVHEKSKENGVGHEPLC